MRVLLNVIWLVFSGIWVAVAYCILGALVCLTIVGIPLGLANFKMIPVSMTPLGRQVVPSR